MTSLRFVIGKNRCGDFFETLCLRRRQKAWFLPPVLPVTIFSGMRAEYTHERGPGRNARISPVSPGEIPVAELTGSVRW
jgi:hypothetical protein